MKWFTLLIPLFLLICVYGCHSYMKDLANEECNEDCIEHRIEYCQNVLKEQSWYKKLTTEQKEILEEECRKIMEMKKQSPYAERAEELPLSENQP